MSQVTIPDTHRNLLAGAHVAVLTTMLPDGQPQSSIVWIDYDGTYILVNTARERQKSRNMQRHSLVSVFVLDPSNGSRWIEIRGRVVAMTEDGAEAHVDSLTRRYTGKQHFYGDVYPAERRHEETRVIVKIAPIRVNVDAIFK